MVEQTVLEQDRDWALELSPLEDRSIKVVWDVSNKCNLRCKMCHFSFDEVFHRPAKYTTPEEFRKQAKDVLPKAHTLILSAGNEPLTNPWFAEILFEAAKFQVPHVLFITNGTRLSRKIVDACIESGVTQIQVSIDGARKATYETIRRGADFDKLKQNLIYLRDKKKQIGSSIPALQFNVVLMNSNINELPEFVDLAEELNAELIACRHLLVMEGLNVEDESLFLRKAIANKFAKKFLRRAQRKGIGVVSFPDFFDQEHGGDSAGESRIYDPDRPFGYIDLPAPLDRVTASSPVLTGWALGKGSILGVTLERMAFPGENAQLNEREMIHVADCKTGVSREDVGRQYPDFPGSTQAGWIAEVDVNEPWVRLSEVPMIYVVAFSYNGSVSVVGHRLLQRPGST